MKSFIERFVRNQSGAVGFDDGLTVLCLTIGFAAALMLVHSSIIQLFAAIFDVFTGSR